MRVTSKGQVTIPSDFRELRASQPSSEVSLRSRREARASLPRKREQSRDEDRERLAHLLATLERLEGTGDRSLRADDVMSLTRDRLEHASPRRYECSDRHAVRDAGLAEMVAVRQRRAIAPGWQRSSSTRSSIPSWLDALSRPWTMVDALLAGRCVPAEGLPWEAAFAGRLAHSRTTAARRRARKRSARFLIGAHAVIRGYAFSRAIPRATGPISRRSTSSLRTPHP